MNKNQTIKNSLFLLFPLFLGVKLWLFPGIAKLPPPLEYFSPGIPGVVLLLFGPLLLMRGHRARYRTGLALYAFASLLIAVQALYMRYFTRPFSIHVLLQLGNLHGLGPSIGSLFSWREFFLLADIPFFLFLGRKVPRRNDDRRRVIPAARVILLGIILTGAGPAGAKFFLKTDPVNIWREEVNLSNYNVIGYQLLDLMVTLKSRLNENLAPEEVREVKSWLEKNKTKNLTPAGSNLFGTGKGKNLIIIQCEALAGFVMNKKFRGKEITPNLNRLAAKSLYFTNHHCQNYHGGSADAELILFASLLPPLKGSAFFRFPHNSYTTLPKLLKEKGYATSAIHGNRSSFWNRGETYPALGITTFYDSQKMFGTGKWVNNDRRAFDHAAAIYEKEKQPFCSILITIETHLGGDLTNVEGYFKAIQKLDANLGRFLLHLKNSRILDKSVLVIYGDHPPYLDYERIKKERHEYAWIIEKGRRIPFIIHVPGVKGRKITHLTGQVDAFPALAHIMGIDPRRYTGRIMGKNPFTTKENWVLLYPDDYLSHEKNTPIEELACRKKGFHISDMIIRSNYFKNYDLRGSK